MCPPLCPWASNQACPSKASTPSAATASCLDVVHVSLRPVSESRAVGGVYDVRSKTQCVALVFQMQKLWKHIKHKYENKE